MRSWLMKRNNWKPFLTGLATGGSIGFVNIFFKGEHLLMRALLSAYIAAVLASFIEYVIKVPKTSE
ncbi:MAG: hypothetical protein ACKO9A_09450 [Alphaproteobacteria bacterium]